jgi:hypothetical protein
MRLLKSLRPFSVALVPAITLPLLAPGPTLAADTDLQIQDLSGREIMKRRILERVAGRLGALFGLGG